MITAIVFFPLITSIISGFFYKLIGEKFSIILTTLSVFISAVLSWIVFFTFDTKNQINYEILDWIDSGNLKVSWAILIDSLTVVMLVVVTSVSALVHLYSFGYMAKDYNWKSNEPYKARFFSYLSFFTFTMLVLVTSNNLVQMFFGWEGVGVASYLLIGFYYKKQSANNAAIKAFIVNRVGDFGFALGIFLLFSLTGSLNFTDIFKSLDSHSQSIFSMFGYDFIALELIAILLFLGAMGKSAQFILHTWLPDAMEGPTPVSALIHAATMVTAGVFLVCRISPILEITEIAKNVIIIVGTVTALFAATAALVQNDIKRVIAYSTCSQLGYMFVSAGVGFYHGAMFHLFTHAFFKALLFLCAGSVIHAMHHEQDLRNYGGLRKKIPVTFWCMIIGTISITGLGVPFGYDLFHLPIGMAGFASKDSIIEAVFASGSRISEVSFWILIVAAIMTSFYSWRLIFLTFFGSFRGNVKDYDNSHESPIVMIIPLIILSLGAIFAGILFYNTFVGDFSKYFFAKSIILNENNTLLKDFHYVSWWVKCSPFLAMIIGFITAYLFYIRFPLFPKYLATQHYGLYTFFLKKWYFDEIYEILLIKPTKFLGKFLWIFGDGKVIDGFINIIALNFLPKISKLASKMQSGYLFHYAFGIIVGLTGLITWFTIINSVN